MKIKKGDTVQVIAGRGRRGKSLSADPATNDPLRGEVLRVLPKENRLVVQGVNLVKKAQRARPTGGRTQARAGIIEFELNVKINEASQETRAKINAIRNELPEAMKDPVIQKFDFNAMPVVSLSVKSKTLNARDLTTLADRKIKRRLESIPGVAKAKLIGGSQREIAVNIDPARLAAFCPGAEYGPAKSPAPCLRRPPPPRPRGGRRRFRLNLWEHRLRKPLTGVLLGQTPHEQGREHPRIH